MAENDTTSSSETSRLADSSRSDRSSEARVSLSDTSRDALSGNKSDSSDKPATPAERAFGQERMAAESRPAKERMERDIAQAKGLAETGFKPTPPDAGIVQSLKEKAITAAAQRLGTAQAAAGWVGDMVGGAAAVVETGWEAGVAGAEAATGLVPDAYANKQQADLKARADGLKAAAEELISNPAGVAEAIAESYQARFAQANTLEAAYRTGHADESVLFEAERVRSEATAELEILGVETAATVVGVGAIAKGLRAARIADNLGDARPLATAMAATRRTREATEAIENLIVDPVRTRQLSITDVHEARGGYGPNAALRPGSIRGQYSNRDYVPENIGLPIQKLDWREAKFTTEGVAEARLHVARFGPSARNETMLDRLDRIVDGTLQPTDYDRRFYTHELRELERYRALGHADSSNPSYEVWEDLHAATLEDYQLHEHLENGSPSLYHPEALQ
jgi:hypothetical protein